MGTQIPLGTELPEWNTQTPTHLRSPSNSFHDQPDNPKDRKDSVGPGWFQMYRAFCILMAAWSVTVAKKSSAI